MYVNLFFFLFWTVLVGSAAYAWGRSHSPWGYRRGYKDGFDRGYRSVVLPALEALQEHPIPRQRPGSRGAHRAG